MSISDFIGKKKPQSIKHLAIEPLELNEAVRSNSHLETDFNDYFGNDTERYFVKPKSELGNIKFLLKYTDQMFFFLFSLLNLIQFIFSLAFCELIFRP